MARYFASCGFEFMVFHVLFVWLWFDSMESWPFWPIMVIDAATQVVDLGSFGVALGAYFVTYWLWRSSPCDSCMEPRLK